MTYVIGIDYSMHCPAMCRWPMDAGQPRFPDCELMFVNDSAKFSFEEKRFGGLGGVIGILSDKKYECDEQRFDFLASSFLNLINPDDVVFLEDYAFAAKGRVFNIGENTGNLKHQLWINGTQFHVVPPTVIKKFATGKGNADKTAMEAAFVAETGISLRETFEQTDKQWSPSGDLIDAYYLCRYGYENLIVNKLPSPEKS